MVPWDFVSIISSTSPCISARKVQSFSAFDKIENWDSEMKWLSQKAETELECWSFHSQFYMRLSLPAVMKFREKKEFVKFWSGVVFPRLGAPGKNTGVGCHFLLQCRKVKSEREVAVVSDSLWPHGPQPTRLLCPWDFPGKSTGVGCHCLLRVMCYWTQW